MPALNFGGGQRPVGSAPKLPWLPLLQYSVVEARPLVVRHSVSLDDGAAPPSSAQQGADVVWFRQRFKIYMKVASRRFHTFKRLFIRFSMAASRLLSSSRRAVVSDARRRE
mmetsp:Transcript_54019/g.175603  ORF Transcript_54019/g.175603 Transcript_54019/m.175603 type:complete len:111 (+) Transcript_54019:951-1283(+)